MKTKTLKVGPKVVTINYDPTSKKKGKGGRTFPPDKGGKSKWNDMKFQSGEGVAAQMKAIKIPSDMGLAEQEAVMDHYRNMGAVRTQEDADRLHMFWSSFKVPRGLTHEEVRLCILLQPLRTIPRRFGERDLFEEMLVCKKMTRQRFQTVMQKFVRSIVNRLDSYDKVSWVKLTPGQRLMPSDMWASEDPNRIEMQGVNGFDLKMAAVHCDYVGKCVREININTGAFWRPASVTSVT
jgi:hypothetical protein